MTLELFTSTLISTGYFGASKDALITDLFKHAGNTHDLSESTASKWRQGKRNCKPKKYFPEETVEEMQFIDRLRSRTKAPGAWRQVQQAFKDIEASNDPPSCFNTEIYDSPSCVNTETNDPDIFYWSLLNEFQRLFKLPESDCPYVEAENGSSPTETPDYEQKPEKESGTKLEPETVAQTQQVVDLFTEEYSLYKIDIKLIRTSAYIGYVDHICTTGQVSIPIGPCIDSPITLITTYDWEKELRAVDQFVESVQAMITRPYTRSIDMSGELINKINQYSDTIDEHKRVFLGFVKDTREMSRLQLFSQRYPDTPLADPIAQLKEYEAKLTELYNSITSSAVEE